MNIKELEEYSRILGKLKPCPLCNNEVTDIQRRNDLNIESMSEYTIKCSNCNLSLKSYTAKDLISKWNTRYISEKDKRIIKYDLF